MKLNNLKKKFYRKKLRKLIREKKKRKMHLKSLRKIKMKKLLSFWRKRRTANINNILSKNITKYKIN